VLGGRDDSLKVGLGFGSPFGAEVVCHFAMDDAASQRLFRFVIGRWNFGITQEVQQLIAMRREAIEQLARCFAPDRFLQQLIESVSSGLRRH